MVKPQDDVAVVAIVLEVGARNGHRLIGVGVEDGKRAGSIEADSLNLGGLDSGFLNDAANAVADTLPNIGGRLFLEGSQRSKYLRETTVSKTYIVANFGLPKLDVLRRKGLDVSGLVDDTGSGRASSDVHTNVVLLVGVCQFLMSH